MSSGKCKHERIWITELGGWITEHNRNKYGEWGHNNESGCYDAVVRAECPDCGRKWKYSRYHAPKWFKRYLDEIGI